MSIVDPKPVATDYLPISMADTSTKRERDPTRRLHRVATVRKQQGVSLRSIARQTRLDARELSSQEKETTDLRLSDLYRWEQVLGVPVTELLLDSGTQLSRPIMERARMVRIMKTVKSLLESARYTDDAATCRDAVRATGGSHARTARGQPLAFGGSTSQSARVRPRSRTSVLHRRWRRRPLGYLSRRTNLICDSDSHVNRGCCCLGRLDCTGWVDVHSPAVSIRS